MPNARGHDTITVVTAAVMAPAVYLSGLPDVSMATTGALVGTYLVSGLLFSPDLDTRSRPYRRWGPLRFIWIPYQHLTPHRSWISHDFIFGPLIRVIYLAVMLALLGVAGFGLLEVLHPIDPSGTLRGWATQGEEWIKNNPAPLIFGAIGLFLGAFVHVLADGIFSAVKRRI